MLNSKIKIDTEENGVIYYINCDLCNSGYIGEKIDLKIRIYQHEYEKQNLDENNELAKHHFAKEHNINVNHHNVVANISNTNKRKFIEITITNNTNNININSCNLNFDKSTNKIMKRIPSIDRLIRKISALQLVGTSFWLVVEDEVCCNVSSHCASYLASAQYTYE